MNERRASGLANGPPPRRSSRPDEGRRPLRFLLLEDSAFDAELLESKLASHWPAAGIEWVSDEPTFVAAIRTRRFDIVLSDFQIPGYSGNEALAEALKVVPDTPFVFVSGVIGEDNAVELLKRGATDYVIKGRYERLPIVIERALREARDRDMRHAIEAQLQEAGALYSRVVDSLVDHAVVLLDAQGNLRQWNRAATGMFGLGRDDVAGLPAARLIPWATDDEQVWVLLERARQQGSANLSRWLVRRDDSRWRGEITVTPLFNASGAHSGYTMIVRDVTQAFGASQALREAKEQAEQANQLKDQFLAVLSHELRSPLSAITGWSEILLRKVGGDPVLAKAATVIRRSAKAQERLIDDLLAMTTVTAGKLVLHRRPIDLGQLVADVVLAHLRQAQDKGVALDLERSEGAPVFVDGDPQRLEQIVANLVVNAIKFTDAGGRVRARVESIAGHAQLRVSDSGRGIAPEFLPHVFDRLRQEDGSSTRSVGGLGLGLSIAQALAQLHGGRIDAASDGPGRGAQFTVALPCLAKGAPSGKSSDRADDPLLPPDLQGARILLIDDEPDAREVGQFALSGLGAQVSLADNAAQALEMLKTERFDLLVSDVAMPGMDGLALMREVRRLPDCDEQSLPAVALTALAMTSDRQAGMAAGFQAYVAKPIALRELSRVIRAVHGARLRAGAGPSSPLRPASAPPSS